MSDTTTSTTDEPEIGPDGRPVKSKSKTKRNIQRTLIILVSLAFVLMWAYVFASQGRFDPLGWIEDRTFPEAAEPVCAEALAQIEELPPAHEAETAAQRADEVDAGTAIWRQLQADLRELVPPGDDAKFINMWLDDWDLYLGDRDDWAERLREDETAEYLVTTKGGTHITRSLDHYATINEMSSCETPPDV